MSNEDVKSIVFDTSVFFIPRGLPQIFSSLTKPTIKKCELKAVSREDFDGLEQLEEIILDDNEL
jgi:hypothetical protein